MTRPPGQRDAFDADVLAESLTDPARFAVLVDAYGDVIYRYLARRVGVNSAEDLAAETFVRAFRGRRSYRPVNPTALPWLYGIATNLLRDHTRAEQQRLAVLTVDRACAEDGEDRVDEAMAAAAVLPQVARAITELADDARDVVVLIGVEGLSYQETAEALGLPVGTVRSRLSRARLELRRSLAGTGPLDRLADTPEPECQKGAPSHG